MSPRLRALALAFLAPFLVRGDQPSREIFNEIGAILGQLSRISGMKIKGPVAYDFITREKVNEFLKERVKETSSPEEIRAEETALKKFGLVPPDFDLAATTVDVLTEQAAAFYDFKKKKLFISDWTSSSTRQAVLVHELAHALADQNFNLERFIKQARQSDDGAVARMAVMEGQATWLMSEYLVRQSGQSLKDSPGLARTMAQSSETAAGQFPVFDKAPLYIRQSLVFPYTKGMLFQHAVLERDGKAAFAEVFRRPPVSTQQILHPEKYFENVAPAAPAVPPLPDKHGYKELIAGSFGELDHAILLEEYGGKELAQSLAPHWTGGEYKVWEDREKRRAILACASEWDTAEAARRFFDAYRGVLARKWRNFAPSQEASERVAGRGDDGYFLLQLNGNLVTSLEGAPNPLR